MLTGKGLTLLPPSVTDTQFYPEEGLFVGDQRDVTIEAAARAAGDVQILINNAGISTGTPLVTGDGGAYAASKAAAWMLTDSTRLELATQGTHVVSVHMGLADTDRAKSLGTPKICPADPAGPNLDAIESGDRRCRPTTGRIREVRAHARPPRTLRHIFRCPRGH